MKNISWKNILPHLIAIAIFLVVAAVYCKPALQGKVMPQHDLAQWVGMSKDQQNYMDKNGHAPLWTTGMFSGMPGYMIIGYSNNSLPAHFINVLSLYLPQPLNFFFLACICFYFLSQVLKVKPSVGIIGALLYAYATYNPIIITVGHVTKMLSIALMPGFIGSLLLLFNRKYWFGAALTAFFTAALVAENHYQVVYYTALIALFMGVSFLITCIKEKDFKHLAIVAIAGLFAGAVGVATNAVMLMPNAEYAKETIRGGSQLGVSTDPMQQGSSGLNEDYAFSYSFSLSEPFVMMIPRMFGGGSGRAEIKQEESKAIAALQSMPQELGQQLVRNLSYYWGGIEAGTSGPPYVGAIVCFLAILGFVIVEKKYRWWILSCCALSIIMSWGGYFKDVNRLFLEYLPMYNKFRAPSMIIVVPTLLLGLMATLALDKILYHIKDTATILKPFKTVLIITSGVFAILFMLYISFDYQSLGDKEVLKNVSNIQDEQIKAPIKEFFTSLQEDRKSLFFDDILRSLFFIAIAAGAIWFYLKNRLKPIVAMIIIGLFSFIDVMGIDVKYMNSEDFVTKEDYDNGFVPTAADNQILQDKSFYRVLDLRGGIGSAFNSGALTAYFHHSIGGYHPAKLSIYQDLIDSQLYKFPNCLPVINMLNTKYIISQQGQAQQNPMAAGNAWFVRSLKFEPDSRAVMKAIDNFNPLETAIAEDTVKGILRSPASFDSSATIQMISNHNDTVTYKSKSSAEQLAVFSEVYYNEGWNAYIDGKPSPYAKVNYVLRGMMVPAGEHTIEYRFKPASHATGWKITSAAAIIMIIMLLVAIFIEIRRRNKTSNLASST